MRGGGGGREGGLQQREDAVTGTLSLSLSLSLKPLNLPKAFADDRALKSIFLAGWLQSAKNSLTTRQVEVQ